MKRLKKLLIIFILLISFMYIGKVEVEAKEEKKKNISIATFDWDKIGLECIYSDGRKYSYQGSYSDIDQTKPFTNNKLVERGENANLIDFETALKSIVNGEYPKYDSLYFEDISLGKTVPEQNRIKGEAIFSKPSFIARVKEGVLYCAPQAKKVTINGKLSDTEENEGRESTLTYLTFDPNFNYDRCMEMAGNNFFHQILWFLKAPKEVDKACSHGIKNSSLLSVEYTMNETTETKTYFLERKVPVVKDGNNQYGTDAVASKKQTYVYVYKNLVLIEEDGKFKPLLEGSDIFRNNKIDKEVEAGKKPSIYLNDPFFKKVGDYLEPSDDPHFKASNKHQKGYLEYIISDISMKAVDGEGYNKSICDYIPNTAKLIRKVIKTIQILIPIILVITIIIDVFNMVKTDNPDKDIPYLVKKIRNRLILAVVFFLLPVFVALIIRLLNKYTTIKNIATIKCLFE